MDFKNSRVPAGPVIRTVTGPIAGSTDNSNLRNGQHSRSATINSAGKDNPLLVAGYPKHITIIHFSYFNQCRFELCKQCSFTFSQVLMRQRTSNGYFTRHVRTSFLEGVPVTTSAG